MKSLHIIIFFNLLLITNALFSQDNEEKHDHLTGTIFETKIDGDRNPLPGANIYWAGTTLGVSSDADGKFSIERHKNPKTQLVVSFIGFKSDSVLIPEDSKFIEIELKLSNNLKAVNIINKAPGGHISRLDPHNTFIITGAELQKAACCNLSESFQSNASVDVAYDDAITGAKQIKLLGLAGKYSQIQVENIPNLRGLATPYGLGYIPGPWMESIQVSKGTASVKNGYESITGQINIEFKKPDEGEKFYLNVYGNSHYKTELNFNSAVKINDKLSTMVLGHVENRSTKVDHNDDGFLDQPLIKQYNVMNRWKYSTQSIHAQFGIKVLQEDRQGGQTSFNKSEKRDTSNGYGINVKTDRVEAFSKTAFLFKNRPGTNIAFINSYIYHYQKSYFGLNDYNARENNYYGNLMFQTYIGNTNHQITTGVSYVLDHFLHI